MGSSTDVPAPPVHATLACPPAESEAHRPLLVTANEQVDAGQDSDAARTFGSAFDAMDLGNQVGGTGKFAADRAVEAYLRAYRIGKNVSLLEDAERLLVHYLEVLDRGIDQGCAVDYAWAEDKLVEIRAMMPKEGDPPPEVEVETPPPPGKCPPAPAIIGTDRVGVALVTVGASVFAGGIGLLVTGVALPNLDKPQIFTITGGAVMAVGVAVLIPGAIRLATWKRNRSRVQLGAAPWMGRGLAGVSVGGRFGARR